MNSKPLVDHGGDLSLVQEKEYVRIGGPRLTYQKITCTGIGAAENVTPSTSSQHRNQWWCLPLGVHAVADGAMRHCLQLGNNLNKINLELKKGGRGNSRGTCGGSKMINSGDSADRLSSRLIRLICPIQGRQNTAVESHGPYKVKDARVELNIILTDTEPVCERARRC